MNCPLSGAKIGFRIFLILAILCFPGNGLAADEISLKGRRVLNSARELMAEKKVDAAVQELVRYQADGNGCPDGRKDGPCHPLVAFVLGNARSLQERYDAAAEQYTAAVERDPAFSAAWMNLALARYETGQTEAAGGAFLRAYETEAAKRPETLYAAAAAFASAGRYRQALKTFDSLKKNHAGAFTPAWKQTLVHVYLALDRPLEALPLMEKLAQKAEGAEKRQWQERLLHHYLTLDMAARALDCVLSLTRTEPEEPAWWKALAHIHLNANRYAEALGALTVFNHLAPLSATETELAADLNMQLGIPDQAAALYERACQSQPTPRCTEKLASAYRLMHNPRKALDRMSRALQTDDGETSLLLARADLLFELKRYAEAEAAYERAAKAGADPGRSRLMAGYAAWHRGDIPAARKAFRAASIADGQRTEATSALARLESVDKTETPDAAVNP